MHAKCGIPREISVPHAGYAGVAVRVEFNEHRNVAERCESVDNLG